MKTRFCLLLAGLAAGCQLRAPTPDGSGTIECTQVQVAPLVGGRIAALPAREGMALKKGDLIAKLDEADAALRRDESRAALAQAAAQLELLRAGSRAEDIARGREQARETRAASEAAEATLQRVRQVVAQGSGTPQQLDDARAAAERTAATLAAAEQNLARLEHGARVEELHVAEAAVALAQARLAQAEKAVADCTVAAPMDGVVTTRIREDGEIVGPGTALVTLSRLDEVWLSVYVPEPALSRVKVGQAARVTVNGTDRRFDGRVTFVSPEAEFTPRNVQTPDERAKLVYRIKVTLPNPEGVFKPGMPADAWLGE